jgi:hypothetical protein
MPAIRLVKCSGNTFPFSARFIPGFRFASIRHGGRYINIPFRFLPVLGLSLCLLALVGQQSFALHCLAAKNLPPRRAVYEKAAEAAALLYLSVASPYRVSG